MVTIPILDCSKIILESDSEKLTEFAHEFGEALSHVGFVYLKCHGLDLKKIEKLHESSLKFFSLPESTKAKYGKKTENVNQSFHGYLGPGQQLLQDTTAGSQEVFDLYSHVVLNSINFPMTELPFFKETLMEFRNECARLTSILLECLAVFLELDDTKYLLKYHRNLEDSRVLSESRIRLSSQVGRTETGATGAIVGEHSDVGTITFNFQDMEGGLEVKSVGGEWMRASPVEGALVLTTGQLLELWTDGLITAAPHRMCSVQTRSTCISVATHPDASTLVKRGSIVGESPLNGMESSENGINAFEYSQRERRASTTTMCSAQPPITKTKTS